MDFAIQTINCLVINIASNIILADVLIHWFFIKTAKDPSLPTKHLDGSHTDDE